MLLVPGGLESAPKGLPWAAGRGETWDRVSWIQRDRMGYWWALPLGGIGIN